MLLNVCLNTPTKMYQEHTCSFKKKKVRLICLYASRENITRRTVGASRKGELKGLLVGFSFVMDDSKED